MTLLPNLLTAASLVLGLAAIVSAQLGEPERAAWLIVWCVLLDFADGIAARLLNAASAFGAEFDSLADLVAFGLAPAALVLYLLPPGATLAPWWPAAPCALYALLAAVRLARFNSTTPTRPGWFQGVPSTAAGALIATAVIVLLRYEEAFGGFDLAAYLPLVLLLLALAMVSRWPFPKPRLATKRWLNVPHLANIALIYVCGSLKLWPEYLLAMAVLVVAGGLLAGALHRPPGDTG